MTKPMSSVKFLAVDLCSYLVVTLLLTYFLVTCGAYNGNMDVKEGAARQQIAYDVSGVDDSTPAARAGHGMDAWDMYVGEVYLFAGCVNMTDTGAFASLAMWRGCSNFSNEVWKMLWEEHSGQISWWRLFSQPNTTTGTTSYAAARAGSSVVGFDRPSSGVTTLFIFGGVGEQNGGTFGDTWFFDTARQQWVAVEAAGPPHRAYHSTVHWKDLMIVFGGFQVTSGDSLHYTFLNDVVIFNTTEEQWHEFHSVIPELDREVWNEYGKRIAGPGKFTTIGNSAPSPRAQHAVCMHSSIANTMFLHGGVSGTGQAYQDVFLGDLWTLKWQDAAALLSGKMTWTKLEPTVATVKPPPLFGHVMSWCNGTELAMFWGMTPNATAPGGAMATRTVWRLMLPDMHWRPPAGLYEAARAFFAYVPVGCGGWLSDGVSSFGPAPALRHDFENAGIVP